MSAGFLGLPRVYWLLWVGQFINRLGGFVITFLPVEVAFSSAAPSYVAHVAPASQRSGYQGAYSLCWAAASLLAPMLGPSVRQRCGPSALWMGAAALAATSMLGHAVFTRRAEAPPRTP